VRDIFQGHKSLSPRKACFISIGRRWLVEVSSNAFSLILASLGRPWVEQPAETRGEEDFLTTVAKNMLDDEVFPVLDPSRSLQEQQPSASAWDPSKVKKIRENLLVIESTKAEYRPRVSQSSRSQSS
jgi:hypothetical protein